MDLGPAAATSAGKAINAAGQIAGQATPPTGQSFAWLFSGGKITAFGLSHPGSTAEAVGPQGQVTGTFADRTGMHAFLYNSKSFVDLVPGYPSFVSGTRSINTAGWVTGGFQIRNTLHGFVYANGHASDLGSLGGDYTVPTAINNFGRITGVSARSDGEHHAFIFAAGSYTDLGTLGGSFSVGYSLNDLNQVTGESETASGQLHAFATQQTQLIDIGQSVESFVPGAVTESWGTAINAAGQMIGRYIISTPLDSAMPTKTHSFIATLTPSASTLFQDLLSLSAGVGPGKSLVNKARDASIEYLAHNVRASCSDLLSYQKEVSAQRGKKISESTAAVLLQKVAALKTSVGCSS